ncbi:DUF805 domain-containing protein [Streptomyces spongiicola]|uniref:DUF805 domain-containing protein n=1 Tax=Streptomyces spongiicola TaxID=1690221 RepID=A0A2S1Z2E1_9ACTN|nr:DUF805 domain-containing protein [Streptomyces spongiicola]AWK10078.1 DUF805 domain-containing protein [Streptomyces spongiicola]GBQ00971.1 DUF805 domain-containing protein [Streptomyces spongiicola]
MNWYLAALKNYAGFGGRARRTEYWMFTLVNFLAIAVLVGIGMAVETMVPYYLYWIATLVPALAVTVRRLHDTGRPAWWLLIALVPFVGGIVLLVFLATQGEAAPNKYGANPKSAPLAA